MKRNIGRFGLYLNLISLVLVGLVLAQYLLSPLIVLFGVFPDNLSSGMIFFTSELPKILLKIAFGLTVISIPILAAGLLQWRNYQQEYSEHGLALLGAGFAGAVLFVFSVGALYYSHYQNSREKKIVQIREERKYAHYSCDKPELCGDVVFHRESDTLYFTLVNRYVQPLTLSRMSLNGQGVTGYIEQFQTEGMAAPQLVGPVENFVITLPARGKASLTIKLAGIHPSMTTSEGCQLRIDFSPQASNAFSYGVCLMGPPLKEIVYYE